MSADHYPGKQNKSLNLYSPFFIHDEHSFILYKQSKVESQAWLFKKQGSGLKPSGMVNLFQWLCLFIQQKTSCYSFTSLLLLVSLNHHPYGLVSGYIFRADCLTWTSLQLQQKQKT